MTNNAQQYSSGSPRRVVHSTRPALSTPPCHYRSTAARNFLDSCRSASMAMFSLPLLCVGKQPRTVHTAYTSTTISNICESSSGHHGSAFEHDAVLVPMLDATCTNAHAIPATRSTVGRKAVGEPWRESTREQCPKPSLSLEKQT